MGNLHESGEVNHGNLTLKNMLPILGIEGEKESEKQRGTEGAMQWEKMTHQGKSLLFVFKTEQSHTGNGPKGTLSSKEEVLGPMALTFSKEVGWIAEKLGPKSEHWKHMAREAHVKDQGTGSSLKNAKREISTPVYELDANALECRTKKPIDQPTKSKRKKTKRMAEPNEGLGMELLGP